MVSSQILSISHKFQKPKISLPPKKKKKEKQKQSPIWNTIPRLILLGFGSARKASVTPVMGSLEAGLTWSHQVVLVLVELEMHLLVRLDAMHFRYMIDRQILFIWSFTFWVTIMLISILVRYIKSLELGDFFIFFFFHGLFGHYFLFQWASCFRFHDQQPTDHWVLYFLVANRNKFWLLMCPKTGGFCFFFLFCIVFFFFSYGTDKQNELFACLYFSTV